MRYKLTARRSEKLFDDEYGYSLFDNKLVITNLKSKDWEAVEDIIDDNSGEIVRRKPLTVVVPECGQRGYSVEIDTIITNLKSLENED